VGLNIVVGILAEVDDEATDPICADFTVIRELLDQAGPDPLEKAHGAVDDPLLKKAYTTFPGEPAGPFDHLIYHSDCEGYYVPADFLQVIIDERLAGGQLGSSVRLLAETRYIAAALGLPARRS